MMSPEEKFNEYYDCLLTCELSVAMARKHGGQLDKAAKLTAAKVAMRCKDQSNRKVFLGLSKAEMPALTLYQMRTMFDEMVS